MSNGSFIYEGEYEGRDTTFRFEYQGMVSRKPKTLEFKVFREAGDCFLYCTRARGTTEKAAIADLNDTLQRWENAEYAA